MPRAHLNQESMNLMLHQSKVESIERADKVYFVSLTPKRNTIADAAIENL